MEERIFNEREEIDDFIVEVGKRGLILLSGCPWHVPRSQTHKEDPVNMRIYKDPTSNEEIRIVYRPEFEWEPEKVKRR